MTLHNKHKPRPLIDLLISVVIPSVILMKMSGDGFLGARMALVVALAFPLALGIFELLKYRRFNGIAILGVVSVLLTGGIGLLKINTQWLAIKEAAIPGIIGIAVLLSARMRHPLVKALLYNPNVLDVEKIQSKLVEKNTVSLFENRLVRATYYLSVSFFFSSTMNYILAKWIVTSQTGSEAFNEELGRLTLISYPMIALPSMVMMMGVFYYLWRAIRNLTGLTLEEILPSLREDNKKII